MKNTFRLILVASLSLPLWANAKAKKCYDDAKAAHAAAIKPAQDQARGVSEKYDHAQKQAREMRERVATMRKAGEPEAKIQAGEKLAKEKEAKEIEVFKQRMNADKKLKEAQATADKKKTEDSAKCGKM